MPPVRFSSLPIRGADAARADGADESIWKLTAAWHRRSKFPRETGKRPGDALLAGAILRVPRRAFQIAAPGRPDPISWIDQLAIWVQFRLAASAAIYWSDATRGGLIPGSAILPKVNQSGRV